MNTSPQFSVRILRSLEEISDFRNFWETHQHYPDADIDFYSAFCKANESSVSPCIFVLMKQDAPEAMMIGRIDHTDYKFNFGYKVLLTAKVRSLNILYGGFLGTLTNSVYNTFLKEIMNALLRKEADIAFFNHLTSDSPMYRLATGSPAFLCRDHVLRENTHWRATLHGSFDQFYQTRSKKFKRTINLFTNRTKNQYGENRTVRCLQDINEFDRIIDDIETIASKTYHRGMNVGFIDNPVTRDRIKIALERKLFRAYLMYLDGRPAAYMMGMKYGGVFYPQATGYDPGYNHYSPGTLIIMEMFKELYREGDVRAVDFGFGDAFYKHNFCDDQWQETPVYIYAPNVKGLMINSGKSFLDFLSHSTHYTLNKLNLTDKVKKFWRGRLASADQNDENHG